MMGEDKPEEQAAEQPEIVVDEDWKAQAEAEKEKLAEQEEAGAAAGTSGGAAGAAREARSLPPASFAALVSSIVTQIMFALGAIEDPQTKRRYRDLALAKHNIDMLAVLEAKTKGNLTEEEKRLLDQALYEVRMQYVRLAQMG